MPSPNLYVAASTALSRSAIEQCRLGAQKMADTLLEPVIMAIVDDATQAKIQAALSSSGGKGYLLRPISTAPMGSAPFVYNDDGTPNWAAMWTGFCELALYGGPPHRGPDSALSARESFGSPQPNFDAIEEIRRGIAATTGLEAQPGNPGWVEVACTSKKMAAWLCATIILENVDARCDGLKLFLPASRDFKLTDEVKIPAPTQAAAAVPRTTSAEWRVIIHEDIETLDPTATYGQFTNVMISHAMDPLVQFVLRGDTFQPMGYLAETWEPIQPAGYRFVLRQGIKFHNGRLITPDDVKYSLDQYQDPKVPRNSLARPIKSVTVADPRTIEVTTDGSSVTL